MSSGPARIEIRDVRKVFTDRESGREVAAISGLSLRVTEKEFAVLIGPSGCGKSTLLYMVAGFERPTSGRILLNDAEVQGPAPDRGIVFQEYVLFPWKTVLGNVRFGLDLKGVPRAEADRIARDYVRLVGLDGFEHAHTHTLSGGMKQRVAIARALAYDPDVLLMDEPFGALDAQTRNILIRDLMRIHQETHKTIVFVTHSVQEAILLGDRIFVLSARPSTLKETLAVNLPRPRSLTDPEFVSLQDRIMETLSAEVERTMRAERA